MPTSRYQRYLRSPQWREKRRRILIRCKHKCERCGLWRAVNVHHLTYARLYDEPLSDLMAVCIRCHQELHDGSEADRVSGDGG